MSKTFVSGTVVEESAKVNIPKVDFPGTFAIIKDEPTEAVLTCTLSPIDQANNFRFGRTIVQDIYKGKSINPVNQNSNTKGIKILCQQTVNAKSVDLTTGKETFLPISCHIVLTTPMCSDITGTILQEVVRRTVAGLIGPEDTTGVEIDKLLRGALTKGL